MKNLLLIAFAALALSMGANVVDACPACKGKTTVKSEKKIEKADVKKADKAEVVEVKGVKADVKKADGECCPGGECPAGCCEGDKVVVKTKTDKGANKGVPMKKASAGQLVKADRDCAGTCKKAANGQAVAADGCGSGCGGCSDCGSTSCEKAKADCGSKGCDKAEAKTKKVSN